MCQHFCEARSQKSLSALSHPYFSQAGNELVLDVDENAQLEQYLGAAFSLKLKFPY